MSVDLHMHSYYSDGLSSPAAVVRLAYERGLKCIALTDHDCIDGIAEAREAAQQYSVKLISGLEISCQFNGLDLHVIGLGVDIQNTLLLERLNALIELRHQRALAIADRLSHVGLLNAYEKARLLTNARMIGRVHFARCLINEGFVKDMRHAFKHYLGKGKLAYVKTMWPSLEEVLAIIKSAGGIGILAHPLRYQLTTNRLKHLLINFKNVGGMGIEVITSNHTEAEVKWLTAKSCELGLEASMGSDFHGDENMSNLLGRLQNLPTECVPVWQRWSKFDEPIISNSN